MPVLYSNFEEIIARNSITAIIIGSAILTILTTLSLLLKKSNNSLKKFLFISFCLVTIVTTVFLAGSTLYLNNISVSNGPVHYHADIEIWICNQDKEINLKDPKGWSNKIGTATLHEHNDKRIHLEGVIVKPIDASLGKFFNVIGGEISQTKIVIPTNSGKLTWENGQSCWGDSKDVKDTPGVLQVFVYKVVNKTAIQTKIQDPASFIIAPQSQVPPGDCIIIEFGPPKDKTDKLCRSFKVAKQIGKLE